MKELNLFPASMYIYMYNNPGMLSHGRGLEPL